MSKFLVYSLTDPRSGEIRYIGKSCKGLKRPIEHVLPSQLKTKSKKNSWVKSLLAAGLAPNILILKSCVDKHDASLSEIEAIAAANSLGIRITNMTKGGTGGATGGGVPKRQVAAVCIKTGETRIYPSVHSTAGDGFNPTKVVATCRGRDRRKSHKGHYFLYCSTLNHGLYKLFP